MIESLHIAGFKLFRDLTLPKLGRMNLFFGENNTGKSCLLEAVGIYASHNPITDILYIASLRSQGEIRPWEPRGGSNEQGTSLRHPVFDLFRRDGPMGDPDAKSSILIEQIGDSDSLRLEDQLRDIMINTDGSRTVSPIARDGQEEIGFGELARVLAVYRGNKSVALITRRSALPSVWRLHAQKQANEDVPAIAHVPANGLSDEVAASLWDSLIQGPGQERVLSWLRVIDSRIEALDFVAGRLKERIALLKIEGEGRIPLRSMGDGLRRMFHIGLAMSTASKGILLIDEFENGLHWRVQRELWAALAKAAKEFEVQIFATTHSRDCIGGFVSASKELGIEDATLYRLEREGDEIYAVNLALVNVEDALEVNGEVR
jgi:predicted ATPase